MQSKWWGWGDPSKRFPLEQSPRFWPFLEAQIGPLAEQPTRPVSREEIALPEPRLTPDDRTALQMIVGREGLALDASERLHHAYGKSYRDLVRLRRGEVPHPPDAVLFPRTPDEVQRVLDLASARGWAVIPFGGGTSVVGGVEVPPHLADRLFLSMDLARLNRVLEVDAVSLTARIEAGILGPDLEAALQAQGVTLGHYPQSFEFSTLGGWVATRSAGQQSNKYGKIEDMVAGLKLATPSGPLAVKTLPARATGPDLNQLVVGSEGTFGIITEVTVRVHAIPARRDVRGVLLPSFERGVDLIRTLVQEGLKPAVARLSDTAETDFQMAMRKPPANAIQAMLETLAKKTLMRGPAAASPSRCMLILGYEGSQMDVVASWERAREVIREHEGLNVGSAPGASWLRHRFELPYLRDTMLDHGVMVDTFETSAPWSRLMDLYEGIRKATQDALERDAGRGSVMCHLSHAYHDGASLYFTFAARQTEDALAQWHAVKRAATDAILAGGGALSHHHAVGLDHAPWMPQEVGETGLLALNGIKQALDPNGCMNPGKLMAHDGAATRPVG
ncbi:putative FAD-linked oxidoreductase [compost metagenome]